MIDVAEPRQGCCEFRLSGGAIYHYSNIIAPRSLLSFPPLHFGRSSPLPCSAVPKISDSHHDPDSAPISKPKPKLKPRLSGQKTPQDATNNNNNSGITGTSSFPSTIPRKPRRGRRSEAVAVEDFVRDSLEQTFASIRQQNPEAFENEENIIKDRVVQDEVDSDSSDDDDEEDEDEDEEVVRGGRRKGKKKKMVVEEESKDWPLDADVGWGTRASEYFEQHSMKNVVGEDGVEIDWEGEMENNWVNEIDCLQWESFAFRPSPLIVLVFERYRRVTDNWKTLKELEKAAMVYRCSNDRLPPRTVKIDINIERDLAYALKVKEGPQILFLRGNKIVYREKDFRTADELVKMIAYFYFNAKKPPCINDAALCSPH